MKAYISVSLSKRSSLRTVTDILTKALSNFDIDTFVFVDNHNFTSEQEREMMQQAFYDIENSDLLIAETSDKAIGIGIEAGFAKAKNKPVIYLRNYLAEHSTTMSGISDYHIIYKDVTDLEQQLFQTLPELISSLQTSM